MATAFMGPRHTTAASFSPSRKAIDITRRLSPTATGTRSPSSSTTGVPFRPSNCGTVGPCRSTSSTPTCLPSSASAVARLTATVLLPTPPLPDRMMILCLI